MPQRASSPLGASHISWGITGDTSLGASHGASQVILLGYLMGHHRVSHGASQGISWGVTGHLMGRHRVSHGASQGISWGITGYLMGHHRASHGASQGISWGITGYLMGHHRVSHGASQGISWGITGDTSLGASHKPGWPGHTTVLPGRARPGPETGTPTGHWGSVFEARSGVIPQAALL
jgi:hypothetical protein